MFLAKTRQRKQNAKEPSLGASRYCRYAASILPRVGWRKQRKIDPGKAEIIPRTDSRSGSISQEKKFVFLLLFYFEFFGVKCAHLVAKRH